MNRRLRAAAFLLCLSASICCATGPAPPSLSSATVAVTAPQPGAPPQAQVPLPNKADSLKFAVIGDNGTGERAEYDVGQQLAAWRAKFPFVLVVMMGDNIYGSDRPQDFVKKFEAPYKSLLDAGVKFYASLGNHDSREQRFYKYFNMDGKLYYTFKAPKEDVRFFALESTYMDPDEVKWIDSELQKSGENWKIVFFHHPLYSSGKTHGSQVKLREVLEPLFVRYKVSLVLNGHDHTYERIKPQNGIQYFVEGSSGQLREGDLRKGSPLTAFGTDREQTFMLMEVDGDQLTFNTITRAGAVIDSGVIQRRK
jgi:predicted MPP superfamily phosphohydrolase